MVGFTGHTFPGRHFIALEPSLNLCLAFILDSITHKETSLKMTFLKNTKDLGINPKLKTLTTS